MDCLYIIIPVYNESETIESVIDDWYSVVDKYNGGGTSRLVLIDDGSKDDTLDIIKKCGETRPLLTVLTKENEGHGPTILYGYRYAIDQGADYIFQTDSDGQTNSKEFDDFWALRFDYDIILGNRKNREDGKVRAIVEKVVCLILHIYFGVKVPDANAPFRLMKADVLSKYIQKLPDNYDIPNIMLTAYFIYYREKTTFREISFTPRQGGVSTINVKNIVKTGWNAIRNFRKFKKNMNIPIH